MAQFSKTRSLHRISSYTTCCRRANPPAIFTAVLFISVVQSARGLPTFRTNLSVAACKVPGQKTLSRNQLLLLLAMRPNIRSCLLSNWCDNGCCPVMSRMRWLETLEMKAGLMPQMVRKHLFWKPSILFLSFVPSQIVVRP